MDASPYADELIPSSYASWRYCITEKCRTPLSPEYITARVRVLEDSACEETQRFVDCYGEAHRQRVLAWFQRAATELTAPT